MNHLSIDIETYSSVDIKKAGLFKYAQSSDFQILLLAFAWDNQPVSLVDLTTDADTFQMMIIQQALQDPNVLKHAYNAAFEWYCLNRAGYRTPIDHWRCTMAHGLYCGYTAGLGATGEALGLPQDKKKLGTGMALIRTFCVPQKPSKTNGMRTRTMPWHEPEKWDLFKTYCRQDVEAEREIERRLSLWPMPAQEQRLWEMDCQMNATGVKVDRHLVEGALSLASRTYEDLMHEAVAISGLDNPASVSQLTAWLNEEMEDELEEDLDNLRKDTVTDLLSKGVKSDAATRMLEIRQQLGKTSTKKYDAMAAAMCDDKRIRGLMQYYGANRTGRYAGRLVQVQNLPRNYLQTLSYARELVCQRNLDMVKLMYDNVPDTLSQLIRTAFIPEPGTHFLVADFSAIEARVIAWLAGEQWVLDVFRTHGKIYEAAASQMFSVPMEMIAPGKPAYELRQKGKVATLALGYGGGSNALIKMGALDKGLTEAELPDIVDKWRQANPNIVRLWRELENAAISCVTTCQPQQVHGMLFAREGDPRTGQDFLTVTLPVGRKLFYVRPSIRPGKFDKPALYYMGVAQDGGKSKKWGHISTWGGKIAENLTQAIARDCLTEILLRLEALGYKTVFHVHDEVIIEAPTNDLAPVLATMAEPVPWAPGLPLKGAGFTTSEFYRKE